MSEAVSERMKVLLLSMEWSSRRIGMQLHPWNKEPVYRAACPVCFGVQPPGSHEYGLVPEFPDRVVGHQEDCELVLLLKELA